MSSQYLISAFAKRGEAITAKKAGLREIPAIVKQLSDEEAVVLQFTENIHRKDLSDDEKSKMLAFLSTLTKWSPKQLAEKLKRSYTWVMLYLPDEFKNEEKAKAGQKGGEARAAVLEQAATTIVARSELEAAEREMLLHRTQCQNIFFCEATTAPSALT